MQPNLNRSSRPSAVGCRRSRSDGVRPDSNPPPPPPLQATSSTCRRGRRAAVTTAAPPPPTPPAPPLQCRRRRRRIAAAAVSCRSVHLHPKANGDPASTCSASGTRARRCCSPSATSLRVRRVLRAGAAPRHRHCRRRRARRRRRPPPPQLPGPTPPPPLPIATAAVAAAAVSAAAHAISASTTTARSSSCAARRAATARPARRAAARRPTSPSTATASTAAPATRRARLTYSATPDSEGTLMCGGAAAPDSGGLGCVAARGGRLPARAADAAARARRAAARDAGRDHRRGRHRGNRRAGGGGRHLAARRAVLCRPRLSAPLLAELCGFWRWRAAWASPSRGRRRRWATARRMSGVRSTWLASPSSSRPGCAPAAACARSRPVVLVRPAAGQPKPKPARRGGDGGGRRRRSGRCQTTRGLIFFEPSRASDSSARDSGRSGARRRSSGRSNVELRCLDRRSRPAPGVHSASFTPESPRPEHTRAAATWATHWRCSAKPTSATPPPRSTPRSSSLRCAAKPRRGNRTRSRSPSSPGGRSSPTTSRRRGVARRLAPLGRARVPGGEAEGRPTARRRSARRRRRTRARPEWRCRPTRAAPRR